jgi:hypothetical protein
MKNENESITISVFDDIEKVLKIKNHGRRK